MRKVAAAIFASPPTGTYAEAKEHFATAETTEPGFYVKNRCHHRHHRPPPPPPPRRHHRHHRHHQRHHRAAAPPHRRRIAPPRCAACARRPNLAREAPPVVG